MSCACKNGTKHCLSSIALIVHDILNIILVPLSWLCPPVDQFSVLAWKNLQYLSNAVRNSDRDVIGGVGGGCVFVCHGSVAVRCVSFFQRIFEQIGK